VVTDVVFGTNNILTIQTGAPSSFGLETGPPGSVTFVGVVDYVLPSRIVLDAGRSIAEQLAADPGANSGQPSECFDPVTGAVSTSGCAPIQAIPSFVLTAISNSVDANILGDSPVAGFDPSTFVPVDTDYEFTYEFTKTLLRGPYAGDELDILDNFQFFQATPIPAALPLFATGLGGLGLLGWRRKRNNSAAIPA
jgi:hypothetical protein